MKSRIHKNNDFPFINEASLAKSKEIMKCTWSEFREALANGKFDYDDIKSALTMTFLKQFDEWFKQLGDREMSVSLAECFSGKFVGRGTVINPTEPLDTPQYDRFMPKAEFIKEDNRFSPPGVEWLYLAIGSSEDIVRKCAERECRAKSSDRFGFCGFELNSGYKHFKVVDLTIANEKSYDDINGSLGLLKERAFEDGLKYAKAHGLDAYRSNYDHTWWESWLEKWLLFIYAKMMSENIFVPIDTTNKKLEYAPFQTLAMYFMEKGYNGIIYASTVFPKGKNIVLFDKNCANPSGKVLDYIIPLGSLGK